MNRIPKTDQNDEVKSEIFEEETEEAVEAEIEVEKNGESLVSASVPVSLSSPSQITPLKKRRGKLAVKYRQVAELAARGWSVNQIGKQVGVRPERVSIILEKDEVWEYVLEIIKNLFSEGDRILASLYKKALEGLDMDLSNPSPEIRRQAREQVRIWCMGKSQEKGGPVVGIVQQFFGAGNGKSIVQSMDEIILQKRKERGLKTFYEKVPEDQE